MGTYDLKYSEIGLQYVPNGDAPNSEIVDGLENYCIRTSQPLRVGCSRRVHRIVYLAVKKG